MVVEDIMFADESTNGWIATTQKVCATYVQYHCLHNDRKRPPLIDEFHSGSTEQDVTPIHVLYMLKQVRQRAKTNRTREEKNLSWDLTKHQ
ncbi:hypothetical protein NUU61_009139 [Penicillium alfredii]|uniref:Uncharacterized protein n=1 Tax=Penicillium alfredii TaxID=1506179 RepID=A0A9W9EMN7_9EURO|nr:uncharacterized protein NUU61_009139 [Penicillium alfredii]KAJ5084560.1 hypothetical protein NUU61_009139 [Penicillium alfredii]